MKTWLMRRSVRKSANLCRDAAHQLVGMQAALHQSFALARMDHFDRLRGGGLAVRGIDDLIACDVQALFGGGVPDLGRGPHEDRLDDAGLGGVNRASQRTFVAGMHDQGRHRRHFLCGRDQAIVFRPRRRPARFGCHDTHGFTPVLSMGPMTRPAFGSKGTVLVLII